MVRGLGTLPLVLWAKGWRIHYQGTESQDKHCFLLNPRSLVGGGRGSSAGMSLFMHTAPRVKNIPCTPLGSKVYLGRTHFRANSV